MTRIGILGYGNLGRGVELAIRQNDDMELAAVYTETESFVDDAQALLKARIPGLKLGYTAPAQ